MIERWVIEGHVVCLKYEYFFLADHLVLFVDVVHTFYSEFWLVYIEIN